MIPKTITYPDLDGNPVTDTYYFNLRKDEVAEMMLLHKGDFSEHLIQTVRSGDEGQIYRLFKMILMTAVGKRSEDGRRLIKNQDVREEFEQTGAFSELLFELMQTPDSGSSFINGILPADLAAQAEAQANKTYTDAEKLAMSDEDFLKAAGGDPMQMSKHDTALLMQRRINRNAA